MTDETEHWSMRSETFFIHDLWGCHAQVDDDPEVGITVRLSVHRHLLGDHECLQLTELGLQKIIESIERVKSERFNRGPGVVL